MKEMMALAGAQSSSVSKYGARYSIDVRDIYMYVQ